MLLKINLTIITIIQLTLLISFISADNNKNDLNNYLRKQFSNDLSDTNSDLKWWEYLTSDTKENKNLIGSESVAFDVVQTHLSEDEENEEIQTTTRAPIVSPRIVNSASGKSNTNTREPTKTRPTLRPTTESSRIADEDNEIKSVKGGVKTSKQVPKKISQPTKTITTSRPAKPIVKSVTPRLVTTTTSSSLVTDSDESDEEEIDNNIIKKPAPAIVQPKRPQQPATKTIPSRPQISGTKTRQTPTKTTSAPVSKVAPRKVATTTSRPSTTSSIDEENGDDEEEIVATTRRPAVIVQPKKIPAVSQPATKTIPSRPQTSGTKTKQTPTKTTQPRKQPTLVTTTARTLVTTTQRPVVVTTTESDDSEDEPLPTVRTIPVQPKKVPAVSQPTKTVQPSRPQISGTKTRQPAPRPTTQPRKQPTIVTTTQRPVVVTTESDDSEDEPLPTVRTIPVQPKKVPAVSQPTKTIQPRPQISGTKTRQPAPRPTTPRSVAIQTTTSKPLLIDEETDNEDDNLPAAKPQPSVAPRKTIQTTTSRPTTSRKVSISGTKTKPLPPRIGTKQPQKTPGTKSRPTVVVQPKVTRPSVIVTTTQRPTTLATTTESDDSEDEPLPTVRTVPVQPKKVPAVSQPKKTIVVDEEDDNEENNAIPISPVRKMIESRKPSRPNGGVKRPSQPGTKTRQIPARKQPTIVTTLRPSTEDDSENDEEKTIVTTTRRPVIVQPAVKRPTPQQPSIKTPSVTKTKQIDTGVKTGTKTRQPAPKPTPRSVVIQATTSKPLDEETDNEDDLPAAKPTVAPRVERPKIQTTTRRPVVIQTTTRRPASIQTTTESDEEEEISEAPKRDIPKPLPRRPTGTKTLPTGTKTISPGTKTIRPSPRVVTTTRPVVTTPESLESDEEDEPLPAKPVSQPRPPAPRPQIVTTTRKPIVVINENDEEEEINEIPERKPAPLPRGVKRPPGSLPVKKTPAIGTKTPSRPGVKTVQPAPRITTARPVITTTRRPIIETTTENDESEEDENLPAAKPQPATTRRPIVETTTEDDESDNELPAVEKRRPTVPKPLPRPVGTKTPTKTAPRKVTVTTASNDESDDDEPTELPVRKAVPSPIPRKVSPKIMKPVIEEDDENELPVSRRPVVPPPQPRKIGGTKGGSRAGTKVISTQPTLKPRVTVTPTTTAAPSKDEGDDSESDNEQDEKVDVIPAKPEIPKPLGRKVVNRPRVDNQQTTIVATTPSAVNNRRISTSNMPVPRPVSFNRRSKTSPAKEQSVAAETTTLEPIPVPVFESTRRPGNPIIQSITTDNEEDNENSNQQLPRKKSAVRNVIVSSDLAKFSSRVRYAERQPLNNNNQNKYSSYSPPLIDSLVEPNSEPFIEINRIK